MRTRYLAEIRNASVCDAEKIAELSCELGYPTSSLQSEKRLGVILKSDDHSVKVACLNDGSVVGWVHVFVTYRLESDPFAELGGFIVSKKYRRENIGKSLLRAACDWVNQKNIEKLRVRTRSNRKDAQKFYQKMGFFKAKEQFVFDRQGK